ADGFEFRTGAGDAHSPDTAIYFNWTTFPRERIAVSPPIYVSGSSRPLLRFWEKSSHADGPRNDETHTVGLVAGDWDLANLDTLFWEDSSSALINEYRESNLSAGAIEGDTVRIVLWYHLSELAAGWFVDDISLGDAPYGDAGPIDFVSGTNGFVNQAYSPVVEVRNYGFDTPDVPVKLVIDSLGTVVYTDHDIIGRMPENSTANATFADFTPLGSGSGIYTMTVTTELVTVLLDNNPANDTLTAELMVYDALVDLESDNGGLRGSGDWEWGAPTSGPNSAYSGANVWATNLSGNYSQGLHTLDFRLDVGTTYPTFGFASWYSTDGDYFAYDGCNFAVSTDNGTTWTEVSPDRGYDKIAEYSNPLYPDSVFAGTGQQFWEQISFDLSAYSGTVVKARLALGAFYNFYDGWYVDDFAFLDCSLFFPSDDIAAVSIDEPTGLYVFTDYSIDPQGTVENVGTTTQSFDAIMTIEDMSGETVVYADTVSVVDLASGAFQQVTFDSWTVPTLAGEAYTFNLTIENRDDYDASNNLVTAYLVSATHYSEGGPDTYGYEWFDNLSSDPLAPTYSWIELTTSPTADTIGTGLGTLGHFALGFRFPFYGSLYDSVYVNGHGYLTFGGTYSHPSNDCPLPSSTSPYNPLIAGFWDNGYPSQYYDGATIMETFGTSPDMYAVIQYHNYHVTTPAVYTLEWEIILHENGDIVIQFADADEDSPYGLGQSATTGIESDTAGTRSGLTYHCAYPPTYYCNDPGNLMFDGLAILFRLSGPGTVAGTVTDANDASPIEGAIVTASTIIEEIVVDTTDASGNYSIDIAPGAVNVTVEAGGYVADTADVIVVEHQTTRHDVALTSPLAAIDTSPIVFSLGLGDTTTYLIFLHNTGTAPLYYFVTLADTGGVEGVANSPDPELNNAVASSTFNKEPLPVILDVTWMAVTSGGMGIIPPGDSAEIVFGVDFRAPDIVVDSTYQAYAYIDNNSTAPTPVIPFSITAIGGSLAGTVTDANTTSPIEGAIVTASSEQEAIIVDTTDASGNYSIDIAPGSITVTVEAFGYVTGIDQVFVLQNQTTTHDVALTAPIATIDTSPVVNNVPVGDTAVYSKFLYNTGSAPLDYFVALEDTGGIEGVANSPDPELNNVVASSTLNKEPLPVILDVTWMAVTSGEMGTIPPGDSAEIVFMVDFRDSIVEDSTYEADAYIYNSCVNDPTPVIRFSITAAAAGCDYATGDVNGSGNYNGLDITYGVSYFKGGADPMCPLGSCPISPCDAFFYCGDVNGSCNYNGLDITYGVAYFKGGADPIPCPGCPPIGGPASIGNKLRPTEQPAFEPKSESKKESSLGQ
ncbi:MAG: carboxypeptidase regulatory-like domain-containing protein, partial [Candidatus Zixiibacteriota bacterium]